MLIFTGREMNKFNILAVWQNRTLGDSSHEEFQNWMLSAVDARVKNPVEVLSSRKNIAGIFIPDLFFYVHQNDIQKFLNRRGQFDILLWDEIDNPYTRSMYPDNLMEILKHE